MDHSRVSTRACRYEIRTPVGSDICYRGCAYTAHPTLQMPRVHSTVYGTVHDEYTLESFDQSGHSSDFGL